MNSASPASLPGSSGFVAVVDDDEQIAAALGTWLELSGLRPIRHASGEDLLQAVDEALCIADPQDPTRRLPLQCAVLDLNLAGMNGLELARQLRARQMTLPIVIITAMSREELERYGPPPPGVSLLKKPFDLDALEQALFRSSSAA